MYDHDEHFQESPSHQFHNPELDKIERTSLFNLDTKDILSSEAPNAIEELEHIFGKGDNALYDFERNGNNVNITHKESRESISVPFNITMESYDHDIIKDTRGFGITGLATGTALKFLKSKEDKEKWNTL